MGYILTRQSRLDRLVVLLETGSTNLIRNTAAQQLADIQKKHPDELFNLLTRVVPFLKAKSWETRTAAAKAVGGIVENAERFDPNAVAGADDPMEDVDVKDELVPKKEEEAISPITTDDQLQLHTLDVSAILTQGKQLLGSAGREYDYFLNSMEPGQRLAHQKRNLTARLGLGGEYTEEELIDESDLKNGNREPFSPSGEMLKLNTSFAHRDRGVGSMDSAMTPGPESAQTPTEEQALSKRQLNMLKRKNKKEFKNQASKVRVIDLAQRRPGTSGSMDSLPTPIKTESSMQDDTTNGNGDLTSFDRPQGGDDTSKIISEYKGPAAPIKSELQPEAEEEGVEWPFDRLCEYLMVDMFDHNWEVRHGAAMGLRELLRVHAGGAGRERGRSRADNNLANQKWLDDLACRLCCVFMLDRFGDYISDNVVAPIRETAGQTLGAILKHMSPSSIQAVFVILRSLVMQEILGIENHKRVWQACHGGMVGMRYLVAVRSDVILADSSLMDSVIEVVMRGLGDFDDDVRAVSAATLIPVTEDFVKTRPSALSSLINIVWDCLSNLSDDLSASTGFVMDLLAKLCSYQEVLDAMKDNAARDSDHSFAKLVPRLYPFLRHTITSVRSAALRALLTFVGIRSDETGDWVDSKALRLVFQNIIVERNEGVLKLSLSTWNALVDAMTCSSGVDFTTELSQHLTALFSMVAHPIGTPRNAIPMDPNLFIKPSGQAVTLPYYQSTKSSPHEPTTKKRRKSTKMDREAVAAPSNAHSIDGPMINGDVDLVGAEVMIRSKTHGAQALAKLMSVWPDSTRYQDFSSFITSGLASTFSTTLLTTAMITEEYAKLTASEDELSRSFVSPLRNLVEEETSTNYSDLVNYLRIVQSQCHALLHTFADLGHVKQDILPQVAPKVQGEEHTGPFAFSLKNAEKIIDKDFERLKKAMTSTNRIIATTRLSELKADCLRAMEEAKVAKDRCDVRIKAAAAAAIVALDGVPKKANATIKGLMDSVKAEENVELQQRSAAGVVALIQYMVTKEKRVVVEKLVGNLVKFYCMDTTETPEFYPNVEVELGILSLRKDEDIRDHSDQAKFESETREAKIKRRGAREALGLLCSAYEDNLLNRVPVLRQLVEEPLRKPFSGELPLDMTTAEPADGQAVVDALSTLRVLVSRLHPALHSFVMELMPLVTCALKSKLAVIRYAAAKCFASICSVVDVEGFTTLMRDVLPSITNAHDPYQRQGAIECIYHLIHVMEDRILPYVIFLIVPVLGRMSDSDNDIRLIATTAFATLVKLVPLEAGIPDPPGFSAELLEGRERERKFMSQMLDPKKVERFDIPVAITAQLRPYQQDGVNWLAFLNRYHLHGILCDDMGLGKTLQTLCIVASDHHMRAEDYSRTQNPDVRRLPSLIVCPPTLSGHWMQEIKTYAPFLNAVAYVGPPAQRGGVRSRISSADVVITSYDICRNDVDILTSFTWNYAVLDEGHLLKNPNARTTLAVKRLISNHRLILSGTPIQNNVLELWSLFDFLMPGFLGSEKVFKDRFAKPIALSRFSKSSSKEQEAGALAVEALHKQVLPFLLRRLKEEVLDDLPPKIIQNYYCDMSDLQKKLIQDFSKKEGKQLQRLAGQGDSDAKQHIFTALNYMRKLTTSPALVMKPGHKHYDATVAYLKQQHKPQLNDLVHAPKLGALKDLLIDCGIGAIDANAPSTSTSEEQKALASATGDSVVSPHRLLIFAQLKETLDLIQTTLLNKQSSVSYLRLDGSVPAQDRQSIVQNFNNDPSIDILLLTTSVGGLGLNLTGADTVVFMEHDWNPMRDLQAMDRAHRIGQKRRVNVYRIVGRGSVEERVMGLQEFKMGVAGQVVSQQDNSKGLAGMGSGEILDLFNIQEEGVGDAAVARNGEGVEGAVDEVTGEIREKGKKGFLDDLGELWDERQYEEEFEMDGFLSKMKA
ncbi:MAG: TATA-binding protein-associated factor mot1 [Chrysothrix sp. TS-e1954]|nr:MAG: TATA-binding protein-associated factor mot1 [Chrysothrix sp. TS-e1954]